MGKSLDGYSEYTPPFAGVACKSSQRKKRERLCRYITRPAIAEQRLSLASNGNVIVGLKTPYDDGTTHIVLSPLEGDAQSSSAVWLHWSEAGRTQTTGQPHEISRGILIEQ